MMKASTLVALVFFVFAILFFVWQWGRHYGQTEKRNVREIHLQLEAPRGMQLEPYDERIN